MSLSQTSIRLVEQLRSFTLGLTPNLSMSENSSISMSTNASASKMASASALPLLMEDVPTTLLESFLPGFGVVRRFALVSFGFDITTLVSAAFILGVLFSSARYLWGRVAEVWWQTFTAEISINSQERVYEPVMRWLAAHIIKEDAQRLTVTKKFNYYDDDDSDGMDKDLPPLHFCPSYGDMSFWWRGRRYVLTREGKGAQASFYSFESIRFSISGRSSAPIKKLLQECQRFAKDQQRSKTNIRCLDSYCSDWTRSFVRPSRPIDTIYMDQKVKAALLKDAARFARPDTYRFYTSRGVPYRRGYLFWGPPGTGKSSLSFALAGYLGYDLHYLSLNDKALSDAKLRTLFNDLPARSIILLEDIDAVGLARKAELKGKDAKAAKEGDAQKETKPKSSEGKDDEDSEKTVVIASSDDSFDPSDDKVTLSGLLNAIDGVASSEGRILIMTSNDPEALDKALIRPGRVDMQVYFGYASTVHAQDMFMRFFPQPEEEEEEIDDEASEKSEGLDGTFIDVGEVEEKPKPPTKEMAEKFASYIPSELLTPAEIQGYLLIHAQDPQQALDGFPEWVEMMKVSKATGKNIIDVD